MSADPEFGTLLARRTAATSYHAGLLVGVTLGRYNAPSLASAIAEAEAEVAESRRLVDEWLDESATRGHEAIGKLREILARHPDRPLLGVEKLRDYVAGYVR